MNELNFQDKPDETNGSMKTTSNKFSLLFGGMLVGLGIIILLGQIFHFNVARLIWPFFIITPGVILLVVANRPKAQASEPLIVIGSIITMTGLLLLYQTLTHHWASWAYAWALIAPTSFGLGFWWHGHYHHRPDLKKNGKELTKIGMIIFSIMAVFFEVILGFSSFGKVIVPVLVIGFGAYLLYEANRKK
ncbi:MAG: hypothetical protein CVU39_19840 [Chloroflexi bacterium HGW-Chloroflexi-10]|nr:MAG: hypothetical protein CVU39_19840 [Chloroflexi bacterium HGW-Chloroflexi-10]